MKLTLPFPPSVSGYWRATNIGMKNQRLRALFQPQLKHSDSGSPPSATLD